MAYPTTTAASDVWSLRDVYKAEAGDNWPAVGGGGGGTTDPFIDNVSLLINADSSPIQDATGQNTISVNGNAAINTNTVKFGSGSLEFDDTTSTYLEIPWDDSLFDFGTGDSTIEMWAYYLSGGETILSWGEDISNRLDVGVYGSQLRYFIYFGGTGDQHYTGIDVSTLEDRWAHLAFVRDGNTIRVFVDGSEVYTSSWTLAQPTGSDSRVIIGRRSYSGSTAKEPFNGYIDDLRITKGVARYTQDFTPPSQAFPTS